MGGSFDVLLLKTLGFDFLVGVFLNRTDAAEHPDDLIGEFGEHLGRALDHQPDSDQAVVRHGSFGARCRQCDEGAVLLGPVEIYRNAFHAARQLKRLAVALGVILRVVVEDRGQQFVSRAAPSPGGEGHRHAFLENLQRGCRWEDFVARLSTILLDELVHSMVNVTPVG